MKMIKSTALVCLFWGSILHSGAQSLVEDALRFGKVDPLSGSTARVQGFGGAAASLGGDMSSIVANPAGLGFFNRGVFVFTPSMDFTTVKTSLSIEDTNYTSPEEETFRNGFHFANIGAVFNFPSGEYVNGGFKGSSLGISLNRSNGFRQERSYEGENDFNSVIDHVIEDSDGLSTDDISELSYGAFRQFLIDQEPNSSYSSDLEGFPVQRESIVEKGAHYQLNIAWGGNYNDVFYFGGGMGIQVLNYELRRSFSERDYVVFDNSVSDNRFHCQSAKQFVCG